MSYIPFEPPISSLKSAPDLPDGNPMDFQIFKDFVRHIILLVAFCSFLMNL